VKNFSPRQRLFPYEYVVDYNATKAAERCGYSKRTARQQGARLLSNVYIKKAVERLKRTREEKAEVTADRIRRELAIIGFSDIADYVEVDKTSSLRARPFGRIPRDKTRAIESITEDPAVGKRKIALHNKLGALKLLGVDVGMFKDDDSKGPSVSVVNVISGVPRPEKKEP